MGSSPASRTTHRTWYLQQKATHLLGGFLRSLGGRRGSDFCEKLTFRENFSQKKFFEKIFKNSRKSLDNRPQMWYNKENELRGQPMDFRLTYEQAVFFQMLLIMYEQGELDIRQIKKELIEKMGEENYKKNYEKVKKSLKNA